VAANFSCHAFGVGCGHDEPAIICAREIHDHGPFLTVHNREVLAERASSSSDGDHAWNPGTGCANAPKLGPCVIHNSDRLHCGERDAHVAVKGLNVLEFGHLHQQVSAVEDQGGHSRILRARRSAPTSRQRELAGSRITTTIAPNAPAARWHAGVL
jgi:hypothetical protein